MNRGEAKYLLKEAEEELKVAKKHLDAMFIPYSSHQHKAIQKLFACTDSLLKAMKELCS